MIELLGQYVTHFAGKSVLLDGFPRTVPQARALSAIVDVDLVVVLSAPVELVLERMGGRWVCSACATTYHTSFAPPRQQGVCDRCGANLVQRTDDQPATIRRRYGLYTTQTQGVLAFYQNLGKMVRIDGTMNSDVVFETICQAVEKK